MDPVETLNTDYLNAMNPELRTRLITMFFDSSTNEITTLLKKQIKSSDLKEVGFCVHKLKGSSLIIGAEAMHQLLLNIEKGITENNIESIKALLSEIPLRFEEYKQAVQGKYID